MVNQFDKLVEIVKREIRTCDPSHLEREYLTGETIPKYIPQWSMFHDAEMYATNDILEGHARATTIKISFGNKPINLWCLKAGQIGDETYRYTISVGNTCLYPSSNPSEERQHHNICRDLHIEADKKLSEYERVRKKEEAINSFLDNHTE